MAEVFSGKSKTHDKDTDVVDDCSQANILEELKSDTPKLNSKLDIESTQNNGATNSVECKFDYVVVDDEEILKESMKNIDAILKDDPIVAIDCEGDNLSRSGRIHLVSVATRTKAFLIDILALKSSPFEQGMRYILENESIKKLMFDCREDSDALYHQFKVKLDGVLDIQLLEVIKRSTEPPKRTSGRRCFRPDEVVKLKGLLSCIKNYVQDKKMLELKERALGRDGYWGMRPLEKGLLEYATVDVMSLFLLLDKLNPNEEEMKRLEIASKIYVDLKRSIRRRKCNKFENNGYLPIDVIPERGRTGFDFGCTRCKKCKRMFPEDEFSKKQLREQIQLCRTCKKVKHDIDTQKNRMRQWEQQDEDDGYEESEEYDW